MIHIRSTIIRQRPVGSRHLVFGSPPISLLSARFRNLSVLAAVPPSDTYAWNQSTNSSPLPLSSSRRVPFISISRGSDLLLHGSQPQSLHQQQQVRFRRHDRATSKPRPKTKKQRQTYNRRMKRINDQQTKHSAPGSKAGPRRQWARERWQQLLAMGGPNDEKSLALQEEDEEYTYEDAIVEELMGNTNHLTSQPTPEPVYLGHKHRQFYNRVADQMDVYKEAIEAQKKQTINEKNSSNIPIDPTTLSSLLPSDKDISNVVRAYRDRHGTRRQPIGIAMALQHLLNDLGLPVHAFGEYTYTSLLTCCRTPKEARRIFQLMRDQNHEVSSYSWSILVDIHSKLGDYEGCGLVLKEMATHGHAPTLAAYTSLLAACYKVCSDAGRVPHAVRAKAGTFGWEHWQELRIVGLEPDAMAYGAILRLCAARGQPERAIGLLEDMERFGVKPTTLCFSAALRSVAKSHETAIRFENGSSKRNLRRESITAHHGKMARQIVIMAESAEVEQDDGFVSALMLCSAAAGDSATAKAILLASEIRRMDHLRTIGSNDVFLQNGDKLQNDQKEPRASIMGDSRQVLPIPDEQPKSTEGRMVSTDLPFQNGNLPATQKFEEREYGHDTRVVSALLRAAAQAMDRNGLGNQWAGRDNGGYLCENSLRLITTRWEPSYRDTSVPGVNTTKAGIGALRHVDERGMEEERKPGKRKKFRGLYVDEEDLPSIDKIRPNNDLDSSYDLSDTVHEENGDIFSTTDYEHEQELSKLSYSTIDDRNSDNVTLGSQQLTSGLVNEEKVLSSDYTESEVFEKFLTELKEEASKNGEDFQLTDEEAREFFEMMQEEFLDAPDRDSDVFSDHENDLENLHETQEFIGELGMDKYREENDLATIRKIEVMDGNDVSKDDSAFDSFEFLGTEASSSEGSVVSTEGIPTTTFVNTEDPNRLAKIRDIQEAVPGLPLSRVKKVVNAFENTLGYPSILSLVPVLRETMPDRTSLKWLRNRNNANAEVAWKKACEDGLVDSALLNTMLQVKTSYGHIQLALDFHREQFAKYALTPSTYSDRLVFQMLVSNDRLSRALQFKQDVEDEGRDMDLASYGSLVQYYSRRKQLGSALMVLKECLQTHKAPPSEYFLAQLRVLFKQQGMKEGDKAALNSMIGQDPIEWLKHGERYLKREKSKKGRKDIQYAQNRLLG
ncbi:PPR: pentatricopeptide repeat domain containing protein [Nitzschia inconspicua]|uniref:PPR: pentatricopeptide repeat domain containing protein n=1 Tax=Nitzschia inconspicua TaxID=303405 RepID=A0A9K3LGI4_9STRA|nr:PPR: pentatricopeptide repeat domain containing protein [Nitzschia inconspicua]